MMGTHNLTCVYMNGEYKVAQYGQWDGYPSGQGATILTFLRERFDRSKFKDRACCTYEPTQEQIIDLYVEAGADRQRIENDGLVDFDISQRFGKENPTLSRDTGSKILEMIQESEADKIPIRNGISFAADSLFCEWAYVIDLDKNTFEVFEGFNKEPLSDGDRFYEAACDDAADGYYPVKLAHSFDLNDLPTLDEFLAICEPTDEDDE